MTTTIMPVTLLGTPVATERRRSPPAARPPTRRAARAAAQAVTRQCAGGVG